MYAVSYTDDRNHKHIAYGVSQRQVSFYRMRYGEDVVVTQSDFQSHVYSDDTDQWYENPNGYRQVGSEVDS